jgi:hypothetical protein
MLEGVQARVCMQPKDGMALATDYRQKQEGDV